MQILSKFLARVSVLLLAVFAFWGLATPAQASSIALDVDATSTIAGAVSDWTVSFSAPADIPAGTSLDLYLPASWTTNPVEYFDASTASLSSGNGAMTASDYGYVNIVLNQDYSLGDSIVLVISGIQNLATDGTYSLYGGFMDSSWNYYNFTSNAIIVGTIALPGQVLNPNDETGVPGVDVNLWCNNGSSAYTNTGADGSFQIAGNFSGTCTVSFSYWGELDLKVPASAALTFTAGQPIVGTQIYYMLAPNVSTTLELPDGTPVQYAWGWVYGDNWNYYDWFETDENGTISLALATAGTYYMEFNIDGTQYSGTYVAPDKITFTFDGTATTGLPNPIQLATPNVTVSVTNPSGGAVPDWSSVYVYNSDYSVWQWGWTRNGQAKFSVDAGTYFAKVDFVGYDSNNANAMYVMPAPQQFTADITPATVAIQLQTANNNIIAKTVDENGQAVASYYYGWDNAGTNWFWGQSDSDGNVEQMVGAGNYKIFFQEASYDYSSRSNYFTETYSASFTDNNGAEKDLGTLVGLKANSMIDVAVYNATGCGGGLLSTGAGVGVYNQSLGAWQEVSNGTASIAVPKGTYQLDVFAYNNNCAQGSPGKQLVTVGANAVKEVTVQFLDKNATITGKVVDPDGNGLGCQYVWGYQEGYGGWFDTETDQDGNFSIQTTAGNWYVQAYPSGTNADNCTSDGSDVSGGYDSGTGSGSGDGHMMSYNVSQVAVNGTGSASAGGTGIKYVSLQGTLKVDAVANASVQVDTFQFLVADAVLSGRVRYGSGSERAGEVVTGVNGFVTVSTGNGGITGDHYASALWGWISNGQFEISVPASPAGGYQLMAFLDPFSNFTVVGTGDQTGVTPNISVIEVDAGATVDTAAIYVLPNDATISGEITGITSVAGFFAEVCADNGVYGFACTTADGSSYSLPIAAGNWTVNYRIPEDFGLYALPATDNIVDIESGGTATVNFEVVTADAGVSGTVADPTGNGIAGATVVAASSRISDQTTTDDNGGYSFNLPQDDYIAYVSVPTGSAYLNPKAQAFTANPAQEVAVNFTALEPNATIFGTVTINGETATGALITTWNEDGLTDYAETDDNGNYTLNVYYEGAGTTWYVRANYDDETENQSLDSGVSAIVVDATEKQNNIDLTTGSSQASFSAKGRTTTAATNDLPAQQRKQFSSANQQVINFSDNASFRMSAYSLKNSADTMTVIITPTAEVPSTNTHQVLSYAYEAEALDGNNSTVGKFSGSVAVTLPYTESQLAAFNVTAEDITMAIYDGLAWQDVTGAVVNASAHTITANVTGFGTFAITTSVRNAAEDNLDATTPDQPTNLRILKNSRQAKSFTVKWKAVENADAYEVELYQDAHSTTPLATYTVTKNQKKIVKQKANTLYRVRVRALDGELFSDWTSYQSVRTRPQLPSNLRIFQKTVKENGEGYFKVSFNQPKNRKKLKAVIQVVDETGQQIDFQLGQKEKWQKKSSFKMKAKKKLQKRAITVADQYLHTPLRVKVRSARILKTKSTLYRSAFVQSSLFLIEY